MKYMGSKNRHAKEIIPILMQSYKEGMLYVEPFVGGANLIDKVPLPNNLKYGYDIHEYLISMWKAVSKGWTPPKIITEDDYKDIKNNTDKYPPELVGYVGFALSYGGKWFGGWRRDSAGKRDYVREANDNAEKQFPTLLGIHFDCISVFDLKHFNKKSLIYCDPPYRFTTKYKDSFDHDKFYDWCREKHADGHKVFVSEYNMPEDFICVWSKDVNNSLTKDTGSKKGVEKLFTL